MALLLWLSGFVGSLFEALLWGPLALFLGGGDEED